MSDNFPGPAVQRGHVEAAPRRVRGIAGGRVVFDTTAAHYVWLQPYYPQYFVPLADCDAELLVDAEHERNLQLGTARTFGLKAGDDLRADAAQIYGSDSAPGVADAVHFSFEALDEWWEEDERIFVHPRNPYVRVDALRSSRHVRIDLDGVVLAESSSPVVLFETGLPPRYYLDRTDVAFEHLIASDTRSSCPYKGTTSHYWSAVTGSGTTADVAWSYDFPTAQVLPVTNLIGFYDERVDVVLDGVPQDRPEARAPGQR